MDQSTKDSKSKITKTSSIDAVSAASELGMSYISHTDGTRLNHIITELKQTHDIHQENKLKRQLISCLVEISYKNVMPYLYKNTAELKDKKQIILNILNYIHNQLINTKEKINFISNKYPDLINALIDVLLNYESKLSSEYMIAIVLQREAFLSLKKALPDDKNITGNDINTLNKIVKLNQNPEYPHSAYIENFFKDATSKLKENDNLHKEKSVSMDDNENNMRTQIKNNIIELQNNIYLLLDETKQPKEITPTPAEIMKTLTNIYKVSSQINNTYNENFCTLKNSLERMQKNNNYYYHLALNKCIEEYNKNSDNINIFLESFLYYIELVNNFTKLEQYIKKSTTKFTSEIDNITSYLLKLNSKYPNASGLHISINEKIQSITNTGSTIHNMNVSNKQSTDSSEITADEIAKSIQELQELIDSLPQSKTIDIEEVGPVIAESITQMQIVVNNLPLDAYIKRSYLYILKDLLHSVENYNINDVIHNLPPLDEDDFAIFPGTEELIRSNRKDIEDLLAQANILVNKLEKTIDQNEKRIISKDLENVQAQINRLLNDEQPAQSSSSLAASLKNRNM